VLSPLSKRLYATLTFEEAITTILDDVIALLGAEYGNVQLPIGDELVIVAQRGLSGPFLKAFKRVKKEDGCACGQALRSRRTVVIRDVTKDPEFAVYLKDANAAGFRAVQSTPFLTSDELLLGMVSTHFANVHEPTPIELTTLQTYSVVAANHAYRLLGNATIGEEAEQMNELLYRSILFPASA
jgi:GAF domain-containing protein